MLALMFAALASVAQVQDRGPHVIAPEDAANYVGREVVVRGKISQIVLSMNLTTHINFGGVYPDQIFTVKVFKANQSLFAGIRDYDGKLVEVQGVVRLYRGTPEIELTERAQIRLAEDSLSSADVSGTWSVDGALAANQVRISCVLKQEGDTLSGSATIEGTESQDLPLKGTLRGRDVTFRIDVPSGAASRPHVFNGRLGSDGIIRGAITVADVGGTFTAKKQ